MVLADVSENIEFTSTGSNGHLHGLRLVNFDPFCLFLSVSVGCHGNIMIDSSITCNHQLGLNFRVHVLLKQLVKHNTLT